MDSGSDRATESSSPSGPKRGTRWRRFKWTVRLVVLALLIGYPLLMKLDGCFYVPDDHVYYDPADFGLTCRDVTIPTEDGLRLSGWFFPSAAGPARGTVVHFHGNAANITNHVALVAWVPWQGYNLLMFDYRGYGRSEGRVSREGTVRDGLAAVDYVLAHPDLGDKPVFLYGQSLGGAVATVVAAQRPQVQAVVLESPFSDYRKIAARHGQRYFFSRRVSEFVSRLVVSDGLDPIDYVGRIAPRPVLVILAEKDQICFPELGRELYEAAGSPKELWLARGVSHLGILDAYPTELPERITSFLDAAAGR